MLSLFISLHFFSFYKELPLLAGTEEDEYKGSAPLVAMITPLKLICTVSILYRKSNFKHALTVCMKIRFHFYTVCILR